MAQSRYIVIRGVATIIGTVTAEWPKEAERKAAGKFGTGRISVHRVEEATVAERVQAAALDAMWDVDREDQTSPANVGPAVSLLETIRNAMSAAGFAGEPAGSITVDLAVRPIPFRDDDPLAEGYFASAYAIPGVVEDEGDRRGHKFRVDVETYTLASERAIVALNEKYAGLCRKRPRPAKRKAGA